MITKKYTFSTLLTLVLLLNAPLFVFCQVTTIDEIKLPTAMRVKYPFLKETFYSIKAIDSTGMQGYFVFTFDKSQLQQFMDKLIHTQVVDELQRRNFFRKVCRPEPVVHVCERKYSDLTQFSLQKTSNGNALFANRAIEKEIRYTLDAKYIKYSHAYKLFEGCVKSKNTYDRRLFNSSIKTASSFEFDPERFSIRMGSTVNARVDILFDECKNDWFSITPYNQVRTETVKLQPKPMEISLNELSTEVSELLQVYMENVKRIRLTEDQNNYYVYCIKTTI